MPYLQNERARFETELQAAGAEITSLTSQRQAHEQAIAAAQATANAAQNAQTNTQALVPPLEAEAATADQRVEVANEQLETHTASEPDPTIGVPNRPPRPNPGWIRWKIRLDQLTQQLTRLRAEAATAHARVDDVRARLSQATAERQTAERQVAEATQALQVTQLALSAARQRQDTAQAQLATLDRWNDAIARDPLVRQALEQVASELSDRAAVLEDAHDVARVEHEITEETLSSLTARRDRLAPALNQLNAQLPAAQDELRAARQALTAATRNILRHRQRGPRP